MDALADPSLMKFGIGQPVPRQEDPVLLRGQGRYTDDLNLPGQAYAVMVRSRHAHGTIRALDTAPGRTMPGVLGIYTGADLLAAGMGTMPVGITFKNRDGSDMRCPEQPPLTIDRVRYVGDPVAMVVAETVKAARDAAEAVLLDVAPLPAVTEARAAVAAGAPQLHEAAPGNVVLDWHYGDAAKVAETFARAAHVTRLALRNTRLVVCAMEPRAALASIEDGRWTLRLGCQGTLGLRARLHHVLGGKLESVRVLTGNVGGSFGMKASVYPEYIAMLHAARVLDRPVKWTDERSESFVSDSHGRDHDMVGELALDRDGHILALRFTGFGNLGAYLSNATVLPSTNNVVKNSIGTYRTPLIEVNTRCVFTNTTPVGPYRGAGRPEANYYTERLLDTAAREMRIDRFELRRRNHITPEMLPHAAPSGMSYDSGDFPTVLDKALAFADADGFAARRAESRRRGMLRGLGVGQYLEVTAAPGSEMGGIRFDADGSVTIVTGTLDHGQGHASPFAQVLAERLGVPFERIRLLQGDTDALVAGGGTGGSRSIMTSGAAIWEAADLVIERGRQIAAHALEAAPADIEFTAKAGGRFSIAGTDRGIGIMDLAEQLRAGTLSPPAGVAPSLDITHIHKEKASAFPNGCHVAEVEIDPETGVVSVVRYAMVNDFGTMVNPLLVEGQADGGVVQGIGQALLERVAYDADGQLLTGSYMDYGLPRADDAPALAFASHPVPARTNILGAKGCGEAGCAGALPAVMNAVVDALSEFGITHLDMPASPERVWQAIEAARQQRAAGAALPPSATTAESRAVW